MAIKYLLKTTETYRLETLSDVEEFHDKLKEDAEEQGYQLVGFSYTNKEKKEKGEVVDEWCLVKVIKQFNEEKDPFTPLRHIAYDNFDSFSEE